MNWINWASGSSELFLGQHRLAAIYPSESVEDGSISWEALIWGPPDWRKPIWGHFCTDKRSARREIDWQLSRLAEFAKDFLAHRNA